MSPQHSPLQSALFPIPANDHNDAGRRHSRTPVRRDYVSNLTARARVCGAFHVILLRSRGTKKKEWIFGYGRTPSKEEKNCPARVRQRSGLFIPCSPSYVRLVGNKYFQLTLPNDPRRIIALRLNNTGLTPASHQTPAFRFPSFDKMVETPHHPQSSLPPRFAPWAVSNATVTASPTLKKSGAV